MKHLLQIGAMAFSFILFLSGCGKGNAESKDLFSTWTEQNSSFVLSLKGGSFGTFPISFVTSLGGVCQCSLTVNGTQNNGTLVLTNCAYLAGGSGDPGCSSLNSSMSYTKSDTALSVCESGDCRTFH